MSLIDCSKYKAQEVNFEFWDELCHKQVNNDTKSNSYSLKGSKIIFATEPQYSPEIEKKIRRHLRPTNDSWRVDETYIKIKGKWKYFYRAVDSNGDTIDFMLNAKRNKKAANRFFKKALNSNHNQIPRVITVDKNPAYPPAVDELKNDKILPKT
jgi:transposase, IS6 family